MTPVEFRETLVKMVKGFGEELIERAEDLVGNGELLSSFDIYIQFPIGHGAFDGTPTIEVTREYCSRKATDVLIESMTLAK